MFFVYWLCFLAILVTDTGGVAADNFSTARDKCSDLVTDFTVKRTQPNYNTSRTYMAIKTMMTLYEWRSATKWDGQEPSGRMLKVIIIKPIERFV